MNRSTLAVLLLLSCGGGNSHTQPVPVALPSAGASSAALVPQGRGPSDALLGAFPSSSVSTVAYADLHGLTRTKLFEGLIPALLTIPSQLTPEQMTCARSLAAGAEEVLAGLGRGQEVLVARFDKDAQSLKHCVIDVFGASGATVGDDGLVVIARNAAPAPEASATHPALTLHEDEYAVALFSETDGTSGTVTLSVGAARFAVVVRAALPSDREAQLLEQGLTLSPDAAKTLMPTAGADALAGLDRLMKALHVTRKGSHLDVVFELAEPVVDQARDLGMAAALAISGVRKYLLASKEAEAQNTIGVIAKDIEMDWEREPLTPHPGPKKLRSFPPVPRTAPRGVKYVSTPAEWKPWEPLRFIIDQPQYYQYEVRAARDGQSADVIAHGDLNGDGKVSTFTLSIHVDTKTKQLVVAPAPVVVDPDE